MKNLMLRLWNDEEGAEIAEWVIVVALLVAVAVLVYTDTLGPILTGVVTAIGTAITAATGGGGGGG